MFFCVFQQIIAPKIYFLFEYRIIFVFINYKHLFNKWNENYIYSFLFIINMFLYIFLKSRLYISHKLMNSIKILFLHRVYIKIIKFR